MPEDILKVADELISNRTRGKGSSRKMSEEEEYDSDLVPNPFMLYEPDEDDSPAEAKKLEQKQKKATKEIKAALDKVVDLMRKYDEVGSTDTQSIEAVQTYIGSALIY